MKRTYLLVSGDFVKTGGMDRANYALASYLGRRGDEVHLASFRAGEDLLRMPNVHLHTARKPLNSYFLGLPLLDRKGRALARGMNERGGRVVVNGGNCRWGDVNWVHHINVLDRPKPVKNPARRLKREIDYRRFASEERSAIAIARQIVTTCERNKSDLIRLFDVPEDRIEVVYYGTDPDVFHPATPDERAALRERFGWSADRPVVAFVGALGDRRKGFDTLFEAWCRLCKSSGWDADLVVVGTGGEQPVWQAKAAALGLGDRMRFLGFRRDVPDIFRASDAHVLPSRYEGYSLVTQEALCCGLPAMITETAGIAERYPAELRDWLIPDPDDASDLVGRLERWRAGVESQRPALEAFSAGLRSYTWDDMAARIADEIDRTTSSPALAATTA
jgi:glycosyltransferase involved in cell wall biosynthesis